MRALVFKKRRLTYRTDYPNPRPGRNEALIKITLAGICNTDLETTKGYMDFQGIPGHEFIGNVEKCNKKNLIGKRVTGEINIGCNRCFYCRNQMQNHCPGRSVMGIFNKDGVFAEYVTLPVKNLHVIADSISDKEAVFIEPLAAAFEITRQVDIKPGNKVCVLGDGKLGLLVSQVISLTGCSLVVVGKHKDRLSLLEKRGLRVKLVSAFNEKAFDIVIDCTGSPSGLETALNIVKPQGRIIIKTTLAKRRTFDLNTIVLQELTLIGSRCGPFSPAMNAVKRGIIDLHPLKSKVFPLEEGIRAFQYASRKGVSKVMLKI